MNLSIPDELFNEEELKNTPNRYKRFIEEWRGSGDFKFTVFPNDEGYDQMIVLKNVEFDSLCSHHVLPFSGHCSVAYIPKEKICGISKLARVVDKFAHKPQLQEGMTQQIADFVDEQLNPHGVAVYIEAQHECMKIRGVKKRDAIMATSALKGLFKLDEKARLEFFQIIKGGEQ